MMGNTLTAVTNSRIIALLRRPASVDVTISILFILFIGKVAVTRGPDSSWDLRNYHLYVPFAIFNGRQAIDLFPTLHTFTNPTVDIPSYLLRNIMNRWPNILSFLLSLPSALGAYLAYRIMLSVLAPGTPCRRAVAVLTTLIGVTGIGAYSTIGSTDSEALPACFTLAGVLMALSEWEGRAGLKWACAGLVCGLAVGLKLTEATYAMALFGAIVLFAAPTIRARASAAVFYVTGGALGAAITGGWWWLAEYQQHGNPFFPFYNNVFQSPYFASIRIGADYLRPTTLMQTLFYPFYWAVDVQKLVWEAPNRDPRFAISYVAVVIAAIGLFATRGSTSLQVERDRKTKLFLMFFAASYILWQQIFHVYRYLYPLEVVVALPVVIAITALTRQKHVWPQMTILVALGVLCAVDTVYVSSSHAKPANVAASVDMPQLPEGAMVILLDPSPMSFLAAFARPDISFVGADNELIKPGGSSPLEQRVFEAIQIRPSGLYGVASPREFPNRAEKTMDYYRLECVSEFRVVPSNLSRDTIWICPLGHSAK